ncbi:hypothetical protein ACVI1J_001395 [Bradyrhizobium diazoefficiens]
MNNRRWQGAFDDPILLSDGRKLITLHDAATVITKLPKPEHEAPEWQAAIEALMLVVDLGGPSIFARIGVVRALSRHQKPFVKPRKKRVRAYTNRQMMKRPWIVNISRALFGVQALVLRGARRLTLAFSGR